MNPNHPHARRARSHFVQLVVAFLMMCLGLAFFRVQVVRSSAYALTAESNRLRPLDLPAPRGTIHDRNGRIIADNVPGYAITLLPAPPDTLITTLARMARVLPELGERMDRLTRQAQETRGITPLVVDPDATYEEVAVLEERRADFPGVYIESRPQRRYRGGAAVGHVVGYLGEITAEELDSEFYSGDHYEQGMTVGKLGIERQYEHQLQGRRGVRYVEVDARRRIVGDFAGVEARPATAGRDITLSIDLELQEWIHRIFPDSMRGAVVALDPADGSVLALYSAPSFDPNLFVGGIDDTTWRSLNDDDTTPLYNRAVLGRYAPASTWKLATAAIALDLGLVEPDEHMPVQCRGGFRFGNQWFGCWDESGHGDIDLLEAVATSCNTYFYQVGLRIGLQRLLDEAGRLGFRSTCGIDLPRENPGIFPAGPEYWERTWGYRPTEGEVPSLSIGQGANQQTPLRMAQFYVALARDGSAPAPRLFPDGPSPASGGWRLDLSTDALATVREGMRRVTAPGGTAYLASLEHWDLLGKSGSGQNPLSLQGQADTDAWFAGMAGPPGGDPEIVVVALVQYGGGGSSVAAPIVAKTADHYLRRRYGIPLDTIQTLGEHIRTTGWPAWANRERVAPAPAPTDDGPVTPGAPVGTSSSGGGA
jgi:penicillin-binding protein 2